MPEKKLPKKHPSLGDVDDSFIMDPPDDHLVGAPDLDDVVKRLKVKDLAEPAPEK